MADPLSIVGTAIAIVQLTGGCITLLRSHVGPSKYGTADFKSMELNLNDFMQAMKQLKTHVETHHASYSQGEEPFSSLDHLKRAMEDCKAALGFIESFLNKDRIQRTLLGAKFDRRLGKALLSLKKARQLFMEIIALNNNASSLRVEQGIVGLKGDIQGLHNLVANYQILAPERLYHYRDRIKKWLIPQKESDTSHHEQFDRHVRTRASGSCAWLLEHHTFNQWLHNDKVEPVIWVNGSPGLGKSVLCSAAIEHAQSLGKCAIFYYSRFNHQSTVVQSAGCLVEQLFDYLFEMDEEVALGAIDIMKGISSQTTHGLLKMARHLIEEYRSIEIQRSTNSPRLLMFLDGLDEEPREEEMLSPFVFKLLDEFQDVIRLWVTSRHSRQLDGLLSRYPTIDLKDHIKGDVRSYVEKEIREFDEEEPGDDEFVERIVLPKLFQRCDGNFLFARLLIGHIKQGSPRPSELPRIIEEELPTHMADMYERIFKTQYRQHQKIASELFSIVAFAKRPLRLQELEEAMSLLFPHVPGGNIDKLNKPRRLENMFYPLIEKSHGYEQSDPLIQLTHASVKDFLVKNPCVLQASTEQQYRICEHHIADACLHYLMQKRYLEPFENYEAMTQTIQTHHLLTYAAKYWDRHLDAIPGTPERDKLVHRFLCSSNFQTMLQIQSIFLDSHFDLFTTNLHPVSRFRKTLPRSLIKADKQVLDDFIRFINEWKYFLGCSCEGDECPIYKCKAEITRCLSGIMGPSSFLAGLKEKHSSFILEGRKVAENESNDVRASEHFSDDGKVAAIVYLRSTRTGEVHATLDIWDLEFPDSPVRSKTATITVDEKRSRWALYSTNPQKLRKRSSHPGPISLSGDLDFLRIGSQIFHKDGDNYSEVLTDKDITTDIAHYFEEFASSKNLIVMARRQKRDEQDTIHPGLMDSDIELPPSMHDILHRHDNSASNTGRGSDSEFSDDSSGSDTASSTMQTSDESDDSDVEDKAEEFVSEGSTQDSSDSCISLDWDDTKSELSDDYSDDSRDEIIISHQQLSSDLTGYKKYDSESSDDDVIYQAIMSTSKRRRSRKKRGTAENLGLIAIFALDGSKSRQIFHFDFKLPMMLYHSPPAIHPSKPLVVWPLCGGDILFVDYQENTYFIRRVMATTRFTRHVCMKIRFSDCGRYMHIATIEAREKGRAQLNTTKKNGPKELAMAIFVTTHRISEHKTTHSPPNLIHRVKADLGNVIHFSVSKLPFTFTWTKEYVYVTKSSCILSVTRINLFKCKIPGNPAAPLPMNPRETVLLPASALQRQVRYLPPTMTNKRGMIIIGTLPKYPAVEICPTRPSHIDHDFHCSSYRFPSPPVGIYVDEGLDFGGWVPAGTEQKITNKFRDGTLARKLEMFDAEDDCDLEDLIDPEGSE